MLQRTSFAQLSFIPVFLSYLEVFDAAHVYTAALSTKSLRSVTHCAYSLWPEIPVMSTELTLSMIITVFYPLSIQTWIGMAITVDPPNVSFCVVAGLRHGLFSHVPLAAQNLGRRNGMITFNNCCSN